MYFTSSLELIHRFHWQSLRGWDQPTVVPSALLYPLQRNSLNHSCLSIVKWNIKNKLLLGSLSSISHTIVCFTLIGFPWLGSFGAEAALPWGIQESLLDALQISAGGAGEAVGGLLLCLILSGRPAPGLEVEIWRDIHYRHDDILFYYIKLFYIIYSVWYYIIL